MSKLSVVISAYNEEKKIEDCLKSVSFANEIVFIDNSSTDQTLKIARKYNSKIFTRENNPMLNVNKNFGFSKAKNEWILSLDGDERVSEELREEIKLTLRLHSGQAINGYWIPRKNIIFGKWIEHTGWYPDYQLRLFKKRKGKFEEKHVHEMIKLEGEAGKLESPIIHYNYENISQFLQKTLLYTENEADQLIEKGYNFSWQDCVRFPAKEFISRFFASEGYKDALHGLVLSLLMAFYHLIVFVSIWQKLKFKQVEEKQFLESVNEEFSRGQKEIFFWFPKARIDSAKNPLKKLILKIKSKISQ
ncbi:MAG: hypothetical protein A2860_03955 [Candidatus Levybacteria bacterium RIFCSPHIGHO2_01_FULL_37_33]|nr:MAG: hypothetical protein A2860_03955 [Candidatus Levybacteria bacterium RIFCSPHIGHO2_01_FULL_37_33]OGH33048.1 MAG: hypothetical protein A2953_00050 [Candidatus Levybacteria bacterium RIFCSPLOWO2_01_FULL_36_54]